MKKDMTQASKISMSVLLIPLTAVLATVFIVNSGLVNGIVSGKYFWFYGCMALVAPAALLAFIIERRKMSITIPDVLLVLFALAAFMTGLKSVTTVKYVNLGLLVLLYFYFRIILAQYRQAAFYLTVFFILTGTVEAFWGLRQLYGFDSSFHNMFKMTGSFFNPGPYSGYLAVVIPLSFYFVLKDRYVLKRWFDWSFLLLYIRWGISLLTIISVLLVLPASMGRASWLASLVGCGVVAICYFWESKYFRNFVARNKNKIYWGLIPVLVLFTGLLAGMYQMKKDSADGRALIWKISAQTLSDNPFGVGLGNFPGVYGLEQAAYFESGQNSDQEAYVAGNPEYAFNEYLQMGIELGIIPLCLFIALSVFCVYIGIKKRRIGHAGSLVAILVFASMSYPFSVLPFLIVLAFLLASLATDFSDRRVTSWITFPINIIIGVFLVIITGLCVLDRYPTFQAYKKWNESKMLYNVGMYKDATPAYAAIYPELSSQLTFLFEYAQCLSKSGQFEKSNEILEQAVKISCDPMLYNVMGKNYQELSDFTMAEKCYKTASNIVPNRIYPYYLLANLYVETGEAEKAVNFAEIVLTKEPKVESTAVREMRTKMGEIIRNKGLKQIKEVESEK